MKEEIEKLLLFETELNEKACKRLAEELLCLYNVSHQRELLESFIEWHNYKSSHHRHLYKSDAEEYLEDLNESNCG